MAEKHSGSKYLRFVRPVKDGRVMIDSTANRMAVESDVYQVIEAWGVTNPAQAHALKKVLCPGGRGKGSYEQDVNEAIDALRRAVQIEADREADKEHAAEQERKKWAKVVEDTAARMKQAKEMADLLGPPDPFVVAMTKQIEDEILRQHVREAVDSLTVRPDAADDVPLCPPTWDLEKFPVMSVPLDPATAMVKAMNDAAWKNIENLADKDDTGVAPVLQSEQAVAEPAPPQQGVTPDDRTRTPGQDHEPVDQQSGRDTAGGRDAPGDYGGRSRRPGVLQEPGRRKYDPAAETPADRPPDILAAPPGSPPPWGEPPADRGKAGFKSTAAGH